MYNDNILDNLDARLKNTFSTICMTDTRKRTRVRRPRGESEFPVFGFDRNEEQTVSKLRGSGRTYARPIFVLALVAAAFGVGFAAGGHDNAAKGASREAHATCWACDQGRQENASARPGGKVMCLPGREECGPTPSSSTVRLKRLEQENDQLRRQIAEISLKNSVLQSEANDHE